MLPKQQRAMEGVGPASLVELRVDLYRTHQDFIRARELGLDPNTFRPKKKCFSSRVRASRNAPLI